MKSKIIITQEYSGLDNRGYTCECGVYHNFPAYVYAHWNMPLNHTCSHCGRKHRVKSGVAMLLAPTLPIDAPPDAPI